MTPPPHPAVILAGGQSRRMGDLDKSTCTLGGAPLVRVVLDRLLP
ncbi:MAG: NTP transferase domain-containing protein, partial [Pseudomonadota bacterium]|nr:NTP transferase domain-containing protein [Pseudomonadota bacterium]